VTLLSLDVSEGLWPERTGDNPGMRPLVLVAVVAVVGAVVAHGAPAAGPTTRLTISTTLEGGRAGTRYVLTCGPAGVRNLPTGVLRPLDACRALTLVGERIYRKRLSTHIEGCNYIVEPRRATIVGYRNGRTVRTSVDVGGCERLLVARRTLDRFIAWSARPAS